MSRRVKPWWTLKSGRNSQPFTRESHGNQQERGNRWTGEHFFGNILRIEKWFSGILPHPSSCPFFIFSPSTTNSATCPNNSPIWKNKSRSRENKSRSCNFYSPTCRSQPRNSIFCPAKRPNASARRVQFWHILCAWRLNMLKLPGRFLSLTCPPNMINFKLCHFST